MREDEPIPSASEDRVLEGMFKVVETIFGLHIREIDAAAWHKDVRLFEIREAEGALIGRFYLDLYARPQKRGGAWMDVAIDRKLSGGVVQTPVARSQPGSVGGMATFTVQAPTPALQS